jgi:hypothetical protein
MTKVIYSPSPQDEKPKTRPGRLECSDCPKDDNKHDQVTWFSTGEARCDYHLEQWRQKILNRRQHKGDNTVATKVKAEPKRVAIEDRAKEAGMSNAEVTKLVSLYKKDPKAARKALRKAEKPSEPKAKKEAVEA